MQNNIVDYRNRKLDELIEYVFENHDNDAVEFLVDDQQPINLEFIDKIIESRYDDYFQIVIRNDKYRNLFKNYLSFIIGSNISLQQKIQNIEYMIQNYPDIIHNVNMLNQNIMHLICQKNDFQLFIHFYHIYLKLMSIPDRDSIYPIQYCFIVKEYRINEVIKITMYYLNYENDIDAEILIKLCAQNTSHEVFRIIIDHLSLNRENLSHALFNCIDHVSSEIVEYFIDSGADINYVPKYKYCKVTLVDIMLNNTQDAFKIFLLFEDRGLVVDINILKEACMCNQLEIVKYIREKYIIDINEKVYHEQDNEYLTIIHLLARWGKSFDLFMYLLEEPDMNVNCVDKNGNTILHTIYSKYTFRNFRIKIVTLLLDRGFNAYTKNNEGLYFYDNKYGIYMHDIYLLEELDITISITELNNNNHIIFYPITQIIEQKCNIYKFRELCRRFYGGYFSQSKERDKIINYYLKYSKKELNNDLFNEMINIIQSETDVVLSECLVE